MGALKTRIRFFLISDILLFFLSYGILTGSFTTDGFLKLLAFGSGDSEKTAWGLHESAVEQSHLNLFVENFSVQGKSDNTFFAVSDQMTFTCTASVDQDLSDDKFSLVIKSAKAEIARKEITPKQEETSWTISGTFTPDQTGVTPFACRVDWEDKVKESNERDNREVLFLLITSSLSTELAEPDSVPRCAGSLCSPFFDISSLVQR